jgi:sepiapterin reductase
MSNDTPKSLVIITGASRGIGKAIALAIADACRTNSSDESVKKSLPLPLHVVLIARSAAALEDTARLVRQSNDKGGITTSCHEVDLCDLDAIPDKMQQIFGVLKLSDFEHCWLFNNAGSVDPLGATSSLTSGDDLSSSMRRLRTAVDLNITSVMWLTSMFTRTFGSSSDTELQHSPSIRIVNISSLCAIEPFPTMSVYCAGKAARDMFHMVLAKEMYDDNETGAQKIERSLFKVLNYAPGACDTVMTDVLADCQTLDAGLHDYYTSSKKENKLITPRVSAKKLVDVLMKDELVSGSHLDYWDM